MIENFELLKPLSLSPEIKRRQSSVDSVDTNKMKTIEKKVIGNETWHLVRRGVFDVLNNPEFRQFFPQSKEK